MSGLFSHSIMPSRFTHIVANDRISFLKLNDIPFFMYTPHVLYILTYQWTFTLFPYLEYCEASVNLEIQVLLLLSFSLDIFQIPEVGLL